MPKGADADFVVGFELGIQFGRLPVPNEDFSVGVAGNQVSHVRRKVDSAGVSGHHVTFERLLPVPLEPIQHVEDHDVVVHRLAS